MSPSYFLQDDSDSGGDESPFETNSDPVVPDDDADDESSSDSDSSEDEDEDLGPHTISDLSSDDSSDDSKSGGESSDEGSDKSSNTDSSDDEVQRLKAKLEKAMARKAKTKKAKSKKGKAGDHASGEDDNNDLAMAAIGTHLTMKFAAKTTEVQEDAERVQADAMDTNDVEQTRAGTVEETDGSEAGNGEQSG